MFLDIEAEVITALTTGGIAVAMSTQVPNPRPASWLQVERVGGPIETPVSEAAQVLLSAWADAETDALNLLNQARSILFWLNGTQVLFNGREYGGPVNLPDPTSDQVRYTASWTIRARF